MTGLETPWIRKTSRRSLEEVQWYNEQPGLTSIEENCLSYNFIYEVYGKNACHTIIMYENYKIVISS